MKKVLHKELLNVLGNVYLTTEFDEVNGWIYNNWTGIIPTETIIEGCQEILELMRKTKCSLMLNDNRNLIGSWGTSAEWIAQTWVPQALELGLRRFAHVVSPGIFGQASAAQFYLLVNEKVEMQLFEDIELAKAWLQAA